MLKPVYLAALQGSALTGLAPQLFVPFMESPFSFPLVAKLMSDSGIPQVCYLRQLLAKWSVLAGLL